MRTILITGGNKGIGFATAKYFLERGDRVIITGRNEGKLCDAVSRLGKGADYGIWDISDIHTAPHVLCELHNRFGRIVARHNNCNEGATFSVNSNHSVWG